MSKRLRGRRLDLDDVLHALAESGLASLFAGTPPYGLQLTAIDRQLPAPSEGEGAVGVVVLRLSCTYFVDPSAPDTFH
jgi:hypothetical protein